MKSGVFYLSKGTNSTALTRRGEQPKMDWKKRAAALKRDIPAIFLALRSPQTPWYAKLLAAVTVTYALSPVDLIPDFIPVLGCLDDLLILPALAAWTIRMIPPKVLERCRNEAALLWQEKTEKRWYYAIPFVLVWLLILFFILKAIFL
jgi:uncharacterized membrane protein YkvA (DUF1232 family)